jgi:GNAT superfamily N-acetyltransferase
VLDDPHCAIVAPGGEVFFALQDNTVIGTAAALVKAPGVFELVKMAVDPAAQGHGIGLLLGRAVIEFARKQSATSLYLLTNGKLETALRLYERLGFRHVPLPPDTGYARAGIRMDFPL